MHMSCTTRTKKPTRIRSLATLKWAVSDTSVHYATLGMETHGCAFPPAKLSISSMGNPFTLELANKPLTYHPASSTTAVRHTFSFSMSKSAIPAVVLTAFEVASECVFSKGMLTETLYLNAISTVPIGRESRFRGYEVWPFAVGME